jgi:hypothetical protein
MYGALTFHARFSNAGCRTKISLPQAGLVASRWLVD